MSEEDYFLISSRRNQYEATLRERNYILSFFPLPGTDLVGLNVLITGCAQSI